MKPDPALPLRSATLEPGYLALHPASSAVPRRYVIALRARRRAKRAARSVRG